VIDATILIWKKGKKKEEKGGFRRGSRPNQPTPLSLTPLPPDRPLPTLPHIPPLFVTSRGFLPLNPSSGALNLS